MSVVMSPTEFQAAIRRGIPDVLPEPPAEDPAISRAPRRPLTLTDDEKRLALRNALRYFPAPCHARLAPEFAAELARWGRIYMHRLRPAYAMHARPLGEYPARTPQAAAIMLMIQNNLDPAVAQHPYELITYGGNGTVFQNWAQYLLAMRYLSEMTAEQTLVMSSGHPVGLFPSHADAPRVVVTNGMVIPNYSRGDDYTRMAALGVTMYGQMTAGSYMYIGPQGIVHGTTLTILNAGRLYLGDAGDEPARRPRLRDQRPRRHERRAGQGRGHRRRHRRHRRDQPRRGPQAPRPGLGRRDPRGPRRPAAAHRAGARREGSGRAGLPRQRRRPVGAARRPATFPWNSRATRPACTSPTPAATTPSA